MNCSIAYKLQQEFLLSMALYFVQLPLKMTGKRFCSHLSYVLQWLFIDWRERLFIANTTATSVMDMHPGYFRDANVRLMNSCDVHSRWLWFIVLLILVPSTSYCILHYVDYFLFYFLFDQIVPKFSKFLLLGYLYDLLLVLLLFVQNIVLLRRYNYLVSYKDAH